LVSFLTSFFPVFFSCFLAREAEASLITSYLAAASKPFFLGLASNSAPSAPLSSGSSGSM